MNLPQGRLHRRRVVSDLGALLEDVLEDELTGYVRLHSQEVLLLDAEGVGVLTFENGVPVLAYHTGSGRSGEDALSDMAVVGPFRIELYELDITVLADAQDDPTLRIEPGLPAERLAGDVELAQRTRSRAPTERVGVSDEGTDKLDAVEAFLDDEERISDIRDAARREAQTRASDWGFDTDEPNP